MLIQCDNCEFYNQPDAPFCLDCGKVDFADKDTPQKTRRFSFRHSLILTLVLAVVISLLRYYLSPPNRFESFHSYFFVTLAVAVVMGAVIANTILGIFSDEKQKPDKPRKFIRSNQNKMTLSFLQDEITDKIRILTEENTELLALFQPFDEDEKIEFVETTKTDEKLVELVGAKFALRQIQYKQLSLMRLENNALYYHENLDDLDKYDMEDGQEIIEDSLEKLEEWKETFELDESNDYFDMFVPLEKEFFKKIERTQKFCETVRGELAGKRDSIERGVKSFPPQNLSKEFADFEIERILTNYQTTFDVLEIEYKRLKSENEISRDLLNR